MPRSMLAAQLPLALVHDPALTRADLVVSRSNRAAVDLVDRWPDWPSPVALVIGPAGAGKTHLATVWQKHAGAVIADASAISGTVIKQAETSPVLIDGAEPGRLDESGLFHLVNTVRAHGRHLLLTAETPPAQWGLTVPDLLSRLNAATQVTISDPDDLLLTGVMTKLFADRQLAVAPHVVAYLASRIERSLQSAVQAIDVIDRLSLAGKQRVTRPLAARALAAIGAGRQKP